MPLAVRHSPLTLSDFIGVGRNMAPAHLTSRSFVAVRKRSDAECFHRRLIAVTLGR